MERTTPQHRQLRDWIAKIYVQLTASADKDKPSAGCIKLHIQDVGDSARRGLVEEFLIDPARDAGLFASEVLLKAQEEADGSGGGSHRFIAYAYKDGAASYHSSKGFTLSCDADIEGSEEANAKTLLAQQQRHLEVTQRNHHASLATMISGYERTLELVLARLAAHETSAAAYFAERGKYEVEKATVAHAAKEQEFQHQLIGTIVTTFGPDVADMVKEKIRQKKLEGSPLPEHTAPVQIPATADSAPRATETPKPSDVSMDALLASVGKYFGDEVSSLLREKAQKSAEQSVAEQTAATVAAATIVTKGKGKRRR